MDLKVHKKATKYTQIFHSEAGKNKTKWDFWSENLPSGSPALTSACKESKQGK
jgi:hypothetical protein